MLQNPWKQSALENARIISTGSIDTAMANFSIPNAPSMYPMASYRVVSSRTISRNGKQRTIRTFEPVEILVPHEKIPSSDVTIDVASEGKDRWTRLPKYDTRVHISTLSCGGVS